MTELFLWIDENQILGHITQSELEYRVQPTLLL